MVFKIRVGISCSSVKFVYVKELDVIVHENYFPLYKPTKFWP